MNVERTKLHKGQGYVLNERNDHTDRISKENRKVKADELNDEFTDHFKCLKPPSILITTSRHPSSASFKFIAELMDVFPHMTYYQRSHHSLRNIVNLAVNRKFCNVLVINQDRSKINGMTIIHLPLGPTALFRVSNVKLREEIDGCGRSSKNRVELILTNFNTRLGARIGRLFASLFHQEPQFQGREVVAIHNQRDFIFFRHYRYIFNKKTVSSKKQDTKPVNAVSPRLQELGPRFTLKLDCLKRGILGFNQTESEFIRNPKHEVNRKTFFL